MFASKCKIEQIKRKHWLWKEIRVKQMNQILSFNYVAISDGWGTEMCGRTWCGWGGCRLLFTIHINNKIWYMRRKQMRWKSLICEKSSRMVVSPTQSSFSSGNTRPDNAMFEQDGILTTNIHKINSRCKIWVFSLKLPEGKMTPILSL